MSKINLLIKPIPYEDESAPSFLLRAAQLNKHTSVYNMIGKDNLSFVTQKAPNCALTDLPRFKFVLQVLNLNEEYQTVAFEKAGPTNRSARIWDHLRVDSDLLRLSNYSYCPQCIAEKAYFKKLWLLKPLYACPIHSILLSDQCYQCGNAISLLSGEVASCSVCFALLKDAPKVSCDSIEIIYWLLDLLEKKDDSFYNFSDYWLALDKFAEFDHPISNEACLKIAYEFFTDQKSQLYE